MGHDDAVVRGHVEDDAAVVVRVQLVEHGARVGQLRRQSHERREADVHLHVSERDLSEPHKSYREREREQREREN